MAVDTDRGLVVPVLRDVDQLTIPQIAQGIQSLADKVRARPADTRRSARRHVHDQQPGRGRRHSIRRRSSIIPEVAILLLGRSRKLPVVRPTTKSSRG